MDKKFEEVMIKLSQTTEVIMTLKNPEVSQTAADNLEWDAELKQGRNSLF